MSSQNTSAQSKAKLDTGIALSTGQGRRVARLLKTEGTTRVYEMSDGSIETRNKGTVSWRNNNPGNLKFEYAGSADKTVKNKRSRAQALASAQKSYQGVIDLDQWGNAIFESEAAGRTAKAKLLTQKHGTKTIEQMLTKYATADYSGQANLKAYASHIHKLAAERGLNLHDKAIRDLSPVEFEALLDGMKKVEGFKQGTVTIKNGTGPEAAFTPVSAQAESAKTVPPPKKISTKATKPQSQKSKKGPSKFDSIGHALAFQAGQNITGLSDAQTRAYASDTMKTESGGKLDIVNQYGYSGQYQFGAEALVEAGLIDQKKLAAARKGVSKKAWYGGAHQRFLEDSSNWNVAGGMKTFLADKSLQDKAFVSYTNANIARGLKSGAIRQGDNAEQIAAYAKAAHLKGNGGADALFKHGKVTTDANGTSTKAYAEGAARSMATLAGQVEQAQHKQNPTAAGTPATPDASATKSAKQTRAVTPATPATGRPPIATSSASTLSTQPSPALSSSSQVKPVSGPKPASAPKAKTLPKPTASAGNTSPPAVDQFAALLGQLQGAIAQLSAAAQQLAQPQQIIVDVQNGNIVAAVNNANQLTARRS